MPATTLETVWQHLADTLTGITTDAGYRLTMRTVTTDPTALVSLASPLTPACAVIYDEAESRSAPEAMPNQDGIQFVFHVFARVDAPGLETRDRIKAYADLRDDVRQAVAADVTRGGVAWDTRVTSGSGPEIDNGRIFAWWDVTVWATGDES